MRNINCKWNDRGAWCRNKKIKRSLFGIGARCCVEYGKNVTGIMCKFKKPLLTKPKSLPPPSPNPKIRKNEFHFKCAICGCSINQFGTILFSPPKGNTVTKYHLCDKCFKSIIVDKKSNSNSLFK